MTTEHTVFVLHHVAREDAEDEDAKLLGVYSSHDAAEEAVARLRVQPGFEDELDGFQIDEYELDKDHWTEGFVSG